MQTLQRTSSHPLVLALFPPHLPCSSLSLGRRRTEGDSKALPLTAENSPLLAASVPTAFALYKEKRLWPRLRASTSIDIDTFRSQCESIQ